MKFYSIVFAVMFGLSGMAFININNTTTTTNYDKQSAYIESVKSTVQQKYVTNFKKSTVTKLNKGQVINWMKRNAKKNGKLQAMNAQVINQILAQKTFEIYLIENVEVENCPITEMLFARVGKANQKKFEFSTYFVSNDDLGECPVDPDPGEEEKVCTNIWGENPPPQSFQTSGGLGANQNCACLAESVTGKDCEDSGSCGSCS